MNGGWIEFQEFDPLVLCDDGTMKEDDPVREFGDLCAQGMRQYGCTSYGKQDLRQTLEQAGFKRIQVVTKKVPISPWPKDKKLWTIGTLMKVSILEALEGFAAKPLEALGLSVEERRDLVADVRMSLKDNQAHRYVNYRFCYGQKDEMSSDSGPSLE